MPRLFLVYAAKLSLQGDGQEILQSIQLHTIATLGAKFWESS